MERWAKSVNTQKAVQQQLISQIQQQPLPLEPPQPTPSVDITTSDFKQSVPFGIQQQVIILLD